MIRIRRVEPETFKRKRGEFGELYRQAYIGLEEYAYRRPSDIKGYISWLFRMDPEGFLVAEEEGKIVGFVAACRHWWDRERGQIGEIHELVVLPERQGRGIGRRLLEEALHFLGQEHRLFGLWVGEGNERAFNFYLKGGFRPTGRMGKWIRMIRQRR